jgi:putative flavoprotein involved in K+ transport
MNPPNNDADGDALDVVVIGAGQSGLAIGWHLAQQRSRFVILDAAPSLGHAWRTRWDSLRLFSPAQYDGLPGMDFPAAPDTYPTKDQVADYLTSYADRFQLPVLLGHRVSRLTHTRQGPLRARRVVVATGAFQRPRTPRLSQGFGGAVTQLHSAHYRSPDQLPGGPLLVVGAGNSGLQIAEELAVHSRSTSRAAVTSLGSSPDRPAAFPREVHLAVGSAPTQLPQRLLGRDQQAGDLDRRPPLPCPR